MITRDLSDLSIVRTGEAYVTGYNRTTVRIKMPDGTDEPLCTCTYNKNMNLSLRQALAQRIVAMWNVNRKVEA